MKIGCVKKLKLSFLTHPTTCSRRLNAAVLPPGKPKNNGIEGKTDQARIKNAGTYALPSAVFSFSMRLMRNLPVRHAISIAAGSSSSGNLSVYRGSSSEKSPE